MLSFQNPAAFLLFLLIPLLFILRKLKVFTKITFPAVLADWEGRAFRWKGSGRKFLRILSKIFLWTSFIFVVAALADPVRSKQEKVYACVGTDIVFVVDTSPSMAAKDINGNTRLEAAKNTIKRLSQEHEDFRFGIVVLGSEASILVPPTNDHNVFYTRIDDISVGFLGNGSAIGDGLSTAVYHLSSSSSPKKCIVLLTDGENNAGVIHPETAATLAASKEITIYVVGIGSKGTVPIEYVDPVTNKLYSGYLDSNFNSAPLRKIASISSGRYFEVQTVEELKASLSSVAKSENTNVSFSYRSVNELLYDKFLFIGLLLIIAAWIIKRILLNEII